MNCVPGRLYVLCSAACLACLSHYYSTQCVNQFPYCASITSCGWVDLPILRSIIHAFIGAGHSVWSWTEGHVSSALFTIGFYTFILAFFFYIFLCSYFWFLKSAAAMSDFSLLWILYLTGIVLQMSNHSIHSVVNLPNVSGKWIPSWI